MEDELIEAAARAAARLGKVAESALDRVDLSLPQYRMMALLADGSSVGTALAEKLAVTRPSITALTDGLVERGLVERQPDPDDRRRIAHSLTPAGRAALDKGDLAVQERLTEVLGNLPPRKARAALSGLALCLEALDIRRARRAEAT